MNETISLIGVNNERSYPLHTHSEYELIYYLEGCGAVRTPIGDLPFTAGNIALIPPSFMHGTVSEAEFKAIVVRGVKNVFDFSTPLLFSDNASHDAEFLVRMIYRNRISNDEYLAALVNAYVHFILQNSQTEEPLTRAVQKIVNEISDRFFDCDLSLAALLNESGYAEDYIRAHFKKVVGKTPTEFLTMLRIDHAMYLIDVYKNALTLAEVSERCGFTDYVYFSKKFKAQVCLSPKAYQKRCISAHSSGGPDENSL